jgi:hypothetical protein
MKIGYCHTECLQADYVRNDAPQVAAAIAAEVKQLRAAWR